MLFRRVPLVGVPPNGMHRIKNLLLLVSSPTTEMILSQRKGEAEKNAEPLRKTHYLFFSALIFS